MTRLTIDLPIDVYQRLETAAARQGKPAAVLAREWLSEKSTEVVTPPQEGPADESTEPVEPLSERDRLRAVLRAAGMLIELSPDEKRLAAQSTLTLDEERAILNRTEGKPLSEIILEMRGSKA